MNSKLPEVAMLLVMSISLVRVMVLQQG